MRMILERRTTADGVQLVELNPLAADQKTVAERKWSAPVKPAKPQKPCDAGLFSDSANQQEMKL